MHLPPNAIAEDSITTARCIGGFRLFFRDITQPSSTSIIFFLLQENNPSFHDLGLMKNPQEFTHVLDATVRSLAMP